MCGHNVSFKNDKKKLKKLSTVKRHVSFKSSWVHTTDSKRSRRMSAPDHASDNSEDLSQKKFYYRKDSIQELFSSTEFAVDLSTSFQSPTPIQASSQTLGKWDLWTRLQGCSIIECAAIAVLSNLYNNDCEHIDVTPYSFVSVRCAEFVVLAKATVSRYPYFILKRCVCLVGSRGEGVGVVLPRISQARVSRPQVPRQAGWVRLIDVCCGGRDNG